MTAEIKHAIILRDWNLQVGYRSDENNLIDDLYVPCLRRSVLYQRAVGYFTSAGLAAVAKGLAAFVHNNAKMQLVASPWFEEADIQVIQRPWSARLSVGESVTCVSDPPSQGSISARPWKIRCPRTTGNALDCAWLPALRCSSLVATVDLG